jgi:hypothetical protein
MRTITAPAATHLSPLHPIRTGILGVVVYAVAMATGELYDLNADADSATSADQWVVTGAVALVGLAVGYVIGLGGWAGSPTRLSRTALGLAIVSAALFVVFWSGWPSVFSAVAVGLALEHRRRIGSFATSTAVAAGLGALVFVAMTFFCVTG